MKKFYGIITIIIWLLVWTAAALLVDNALFLPGPVETFSALFDIVGNGTFFESVFYSLSGICLGFFGGIVFGTVLSAVSCMSPFLRSLFSFPVRIVRATPVASFTILALLWVRSEGLSALVSFLMVFPVIYTNLLEGLMSSDVKMIEMAKVYGYGPFDRIRQVYLPAAFPAFLAGIRNSVGLAWKSGIAAEVIGIAKNSVGFNLYRAKVNFDTEYVFAWTIVTIVFSIITEKMIVMLTDRIGKKLAGGQDGNNSSKHQ